MTGLTQAISAFAAAPRFNDGLADACSIARQGMTDTIATMFAGASEPVTKIMIARYPLQAPRGGTTAPVPFASGSLPAAQAACVNGVASHALDYDDVAMSGHPSTALTPAILAQGHIQSASGIECLKAYIVGYETWAELASREPDPYHLKGWHPTAVLGCVAATAALANLRKLPQDTGARALGIAASLASGLVANFGTMTKPLHSGRAGALAFEAIELAELGMTAASDALEHHAGFLNAISLNNRVDRESSPRIGEGLRILQTRLNIKKYPVCYSGHRVIDGVIELARRHSIQPERVARIQASIGAAQASMLRNHAPTTALEAKFSLEFAIASGLINHRVGLAELTDEMATRAALVALYKKVDIRIVEQPDPLDSAFSITDRVVITMTDGSLLDTGDIRFPRGHAELPLAESDLRAKFDECLNVWLERSSGTPGLSPGNLYGRLSDLATITDIKTLFNA